MPTARPAAGRFLFVLPPLAGHTNPTVALGQELATRGHAVAWTGHTEVVGSLLPPSAHFIPVAEWMPSDVVETYLKLVGSNARGAVGLTDILERVLLPLARHMLPGVHAAVDTFSPDVMVVDQSAYAGAAVAELRGLPWASTATTSAELTDPLAALPKVSAQWSRRLTDFLVDAGVPLSRASEIDPRYSPHLIVAFTIAELVGAADQLPDHCALVGPAIDGRSHDVAFPWEWFDEPGPHVLVSLGTHHWLSGGRFFDIAAEAFDGLDARAVFVAPPAMLQAPAPPNVLVRPEVPQLALMARFDAVVSHGGHNTVCESLLFGHPLVVTPIRQDQPAIAKQVVRTGAGVRLSYRRLTARALRGAVEAVLGEPHYRLAVQRLQASFQRAGGPPEAADRLEQLLQRAAPLGVPEARSGDEFGESDLSVGHVGRSAISRSGCGGETML